MDTNTVAKQIEAILFYKAEPIKKDEMVRLLNTDLDSLDKAVSYLTEKYSDGGLAIMTHDNHISLVTNKSVANIIEKITKEELNKDLGKAGLETLTIILYLGPISRSDIEFIRGVNCQFVLRNLLMRGLIDREESKEDGRIFKYKVSIDMLSHLGMTNIDSIPMMKEIREKIDLIKRENEQNKSE